MNEIEELIQEYEKARQDESAAQARKERARAQLLLKVEPGDTLKIGEWELTNGETIRRTLDRNMVRVVFLATGMSEAQVDELLNNATKISVSRRIDLRRRNESKTERETE